MYNSVIVGSGFAGAVTARELAEQGKKVLIIEQRSHIGGNAYDEEDEYGVLIHNYGPHIFHTNSERVYEYLSQYTEWYPYEHEVAANIYGNIVPIPFNLNTLDLVYGVEKGKYLREKLQAAYGLNVRIPILQLMQQEDADIKDIAQYVYDNIFLKYTMKQWGQKPEEVDASVTARVPVVLSYDNRYFGDLYQAMPSKGFTELFRNLLDHDNITIRLNTQAKECLKFIKTREKVTSVLLEGEVFEGDLIYTGPVDELFGYQYGKLPYRSLRFEFEHYEEEEYQSHGVVNYTVSEEYTRITEFKKITGQQVLTGTTIMKEYPLAYEGKKGQIPYYAIMNEENNALYAKYTAMIEKLPNFHLLGRLAEYKYYNMDAITLRALELVERLK